MNQLEISLNYYNEIKKLFLPLEFEKFKGGLISLLQISLENLDKINVFYLDEDNDKIIVTSDIDYLELLKQVRRKEVNELYIELLENKVDISESIINKSMPKNKQNIINPNYNKVKINKQFNFICSICHKNQTQVIYHCPLCLTYFCENCEIKFAHNPDHPIMKLKNLNALKISSYIDNYCKTFTSFHNKGEIPISNMNNQIVNNKVIIPKKLNGNLNNVNIANKKPLDQIKELYDLSIFTDLQIEDALNKANNNFDIAIKILSQ